MTMTTKNSKTYRGQFYGRSCVFVVSTAVGCAVVVGVVVVVCGCGSPVVAPLAELRLGCSVNPAVVVIFKNLNNSSIQLIKASNQLLLL